MGIQWTFNPFTKKLDAIYIDDNAVTIESDPIFSAWDKSTGISIFESQISDLGSYVESSNNTITDIIKLTQAQYDGLGSYGSTTLYIIVG